MIPESTKEAMLGSMAESFGMSLDLLDSWAARCCGDRAFGGGSGRLQEPSTTPVNALVFGAGTSKAARASRGPRGERADGVTIESCGVQVSVS